MGLQTNLIGRLMNTSLKTKNALLPVFEAVVNAIQALEEKGNLTTNGHITLEIIRHSQSALNLEQKHPLGEITGFVIKDNGIGFNTKNMKSFETLDSRHKINKGCRGMGRLLWLKAFDSVGISSIYKDEEGRYRQRTFGFSAKRDVEEFTDQVTPETKTGSQITLKGFKAEYQASALKTQDAIANALLEHCLWYFVRAEGVPVIHIVDAGNSLNVSEVYDRCIDGLAFSESIEIQGHPFELTHIKFRSSIPKKHTLGLCAASRLVEDKNITHKIAGLYEKMEDSQGIFFYACYVSSPYLDAHVNAERTAFNLIEDDQPNLFQDISHSNLYEGVIERVKVYLKDDLASNLRAGHERVMTFVAEKAPRYRSVLPYMHEGNLAIEPTFSDKKIELHLHQQLMQVEQNLLTQGHEIMALSDKIDADHYHEKLTHYLKMAEDIKRSDLAGYVAHRRVVLDILEKSIKHVEHGKYHREDVIHNLIMPMRKDSNEVGLDACNLWLIDERLAFHNYLASDKTLNAMPITEDSSNKEPDLCCLQVYDNPILVSDKESLPLASITVIEIKRPMVQVNDDKNPIQQAVDYLKKIRNGKVKTANGRPIPNSENIPGYCYIICDLTESVINKCEDWDLIPTRDCTGYFGFHKRHKAYIEVMSYDRLINEAKNRNRAFFDKLGLPSN